VAAELAERIAACENPAMKVVEVTHSMHMARSLSA